MAHLFHSGGFERAMAMGDWRSIQGHYSLYKSLKSIKYSYIHQQWNRPYSRQYYNVTNTHHGVSMTMRSHGLSLFFTETGGIDEKCVFGYIQSIINVCDTRGIMSWQIYTGLWCKNNSRYIDHQCTFMYLHNYYCHWSRLGITGANYMNECTCYIHHNTALKYTMLRYICNSLIFFVLRSDDFGILGIALAVKCRRCKSACTYINPMCICLSFCLSLSFHIYQHVFWIHCA